MYPKEMLITRRDLANAIRVLTMDAVHQARSGHPGAPMGMADTAEVLWNDFLKHNPANPQWPDRDRFVLSNGHASMLIYSLLHLTGYELSIEDIKQFRQLHSKTPGHPEYGRAPGVEATTGTLGQGLSNAVGMALAERTLAAQFNRPGHVIVDHFTYVIVGDGCLMEGISHEACSLAGLHGLGKLIVLYDDNGISIDGPVAGWFRDDTPKRFEAYGWHVVPDVDAHDPEALHTAVKAAQAATQRPSLICCKNVIGWGSPNQQGTQTCHGAPLDDGEADLVRQTIGWPHEPFLIPAEIYAAWNAREKGERAEAQWRKRFDAYREAHPQLAREFERRMAGKLPAGWEEASRSYIASVGIESSERIATRKGSQMALNAYGPLLPELIGGSADLTDSNLTYWSGSKVLNRENPGGNYLHYGAREFAMCSINTGLALHGGFLPYAGTFLMFCEYALNALRMAAIMRIRSIFVYTHDSIGVGEDGPTHQAVEQASHLRRIPNMHLWRPCDAREAAVAWKAAIERCDGPTCLLFTRQAVIHHDMHPQDPELIARGGYVRLECSGPPEAIVMATGSEMPLAIAAAHQLNEQGRRVRVVSMPSTHVFDAQEERYRESVLPSEVWARVAIEAGLSESWFRYVGVRGKVIGIDTFGESAPFHVAFRHFGFTVENVIATVEGLLAP